MSKPKVSIVTASFNSVSYIEKAIQSVLMQDYPNIEYIVMDGGSTDGTLEILKKYEGKLIWFSGPDKGIYDALNKGFAQATGDVFTWLDSDNFYESSDIISKVASAFVEDSQLGVVLTNSQLWYPTHDEIVRVDSPVLTFAQLLSRGSSFIPESVFYKSNLFREVGGLSLSYRLLADYELWLKIWKLKPRMVKIPIISATYTVRDDALLRKDPFLAWRETFLIGVRYGRPLLHRLRIRGLYILELCKFPLYRFVRTRPELYSFYKMHIRPIIRR